MAAPVRSWDKSRGTAWQQHRRPTHGGIEAALQITCKCGKEYSFCDADFHVRFRNHVDNCPALSGEGEGMIRCVCPITDARYIWICTDCGLGHWMDATPKGPQ